MSPGLAETALKHNFVGLHKLITNLKPPGQRTGQISRGDVASTKQDNQGRVPAGVPGLDLQALSPSERLEAIARRLEEIAATMADTDYLELLWRGVKMCAEKCEKETSDWVWRNLSLFAYRVATSDPATYSYDEAIQVHRLAIEEVPEANTYTRLSDLLQARGDTEEAYEATTQAMTQESTDPDVLTELGRQHHNAK
eukprot:gene14269-16875_t